MHKITIGKHRKTGDGWKINDSDRWSKCKSKKDGMSTYVSSVNKLSPIIAFGELLGGR